MSKRQIFISHSRADADWVRAFAESLESQGVSVWFDEQQVRAGEPMQGALEQALRTSDTVAFIINRENIHRPNLLFELGAAVGMGKRAVPILPKDLESSLLPYPLRVRRSLSRESPEETARKLLAETAA